MAHCRWAACPHAPVAQLDRASVYGTEGREFESLRARYKSLQLEAFSSAERRGRILSRLLSGPPAALRATEQLTRRARFSRSPRLSAPADRCAPETECRSSSTVASRIAVGTDAGVGVAWMVDDRGALFGVVAGLVGGSIALVAFGLDSAIGARERDRRMKPLAQPQRGYKVERLPRGLFRRRKSRRATNPTPKSVTPPASSKTRSSPVKGSAPDDVGPGAELLSTEEQSCGLYAWHVEFPDATRRLAPAE